MSFRVLLISPPKFDFYFTPARREPLGLYYIRASIERIPGVEAEIYDATLSGRKKPQKTPECFNHLEGLYGEDVSAFSLFGRYQRFGDSFKKVVNHVKEGKYDLVAVSSLFSGYHPDVEDMLSAIRKECSVRTVVGGWAVDAGGEELFRRSLADYFVSGEGEVGLTQLIEAILGGRTFSTVSGLFYRENGTVICNPPECDTLPSLEPVPRREGRYLFRGKRIAKVAVSRGCNHSCAFCTVNRRPFRLRSLESIESELQMLHDEGVEIVDFEDDNLFFGRNFSESFLSILKRFSRKGLTYAGMNGITATNLLPFAEEAIDAGFFEFNLSLVTTGKVKGLNRPFSLDPIEKIATIASGRVETLVFVILGLPGTSPDSILGDILSLASLPVKIGASPLYMVPGITMFDQMGIPDDHRLLRGSALYRFGEKFSRYDVVALWKFVRMINALKERGDDVCDDLEMFRKSIRERFWYVCRRDGSWEKGVVPVTVDFPGSVLLRDLNGAVRNVNFQ